MAVKLPSASRGRSRPPMADINVTPLVDVMLVLLIIFMVTAPMHVAGVPVDLPQSRAGALDKERKPVAISLDERGRIFIDQDQVSEPDLPAKLAQIAGRPGEEQVAEDALEDRFASIAANEPPQIFLRADRTLDYGAVMRVLGQLNRAGLNKVALVSVGDEN